MRLTIIVFRYTLLQVFSKYGKISKLDFLFHKSGPHKGKPRGYAFVEYSDENVRESCLFFTCAFSSRVLIYM